MLKILYSVLLLVAVVSCKPSDNRMVVLNRGSVQGTYYNITYLAPRGVDYRSSIDSIFLVIDKSMSLWVESSTISRLNMGDTLKLDMHFKKVWKKSLEISKETEGAFDISLAPLISAWGFGTKKGTALDSSTVDSLMLLSGYEKLEDEPDYYCLPTGMQIDMNAIAQGYSVDVIADFLNEKGISDYLIEVGGEVRTRGENASGKTWTIGVSKPHENLDSANELQVIVQLDSLSLATSGNYRKYWVDEETGLKYVHTIDPVSGYPVKNKLLSATVVASDCITADAFATACMVKGLEESKNMLLSHAELEGYLVYSDINGDWAIWQTDGFAKISR